MTRPPIVIVGAGPAGAAAACVLAGAGRDVVVLERETQAGHKICGEFLGGPALARLATLGIDATRLGAHPIRRVRVVRGSGTVTRNLPFPAAGLSRLRLDSALRERARALGAEIRSGVRASEIAAGEVIAEDRRVPAEAVLLGTGKHDIRGLPHRVGRLTDGMLGFKMHLRLRREAQAALDGAVELFLFHDSYIGLQRVEGGVANLCLLAHRARLGAGWDDLMAGFLAESPLLRERLAGAEALFDKPLAIARVPYGFVYAETRPDGIYRLGDQMGVIPSFTGEGLAIALHTGTSAAHCLLAGRDASAYHSRMRDALSRPVALATALHRAGRIPLWQFGMLAASRLPAALSLMARATRIAASVLAAGLLAATAAQAQTPTQAPAQTPAAPSATPPAAQEILYIGEAASILGRSVIGADGGQIGVVVDVLVDGNGQPRAAVLDFGGFLGIGIRRVAVVWRALHFAPGAPDGEITLALTADQIRAIPEYKPASQPVMMAAPKAPPPKTAAP